MMLGKAIRKIVLGNQDEELPELPKNLLQWLRVARPEIDGKPYSFQAFPFWLDIYENLAHKIMLMAARQTFKSTLFANLLAFIATTKPGSTIIYVTFDEISLSGFSNHKYRRKTLFENPALRRMCAGNSKGVPGNRTEVHWKNGSVNYMVTDEAAYSHVVGKSADEILLDEAQSQDLQHLPILNESLTTTKGKLKIAGVGGEGGSPLEDEWLRTTESEWEYYDPDWRKKLKFRPSGYDRLIYGPYTNDVLKGRWKPHKLENYMYPGYHLPQTIFPHIPLTERDAIDLYGLPPEFSIEWRRKNYPRTVFIAHVLGGFYKAARRPITRQMVLACMEPYRYLPMFSPNDIIDLKVTFPERVQVFMGIDWGSGAAGASQTVVSILMKWRGIADGRYSADRDRYVLAHLERMDPGNSIEQAKYMRDLFVRYRCDFGVADLGYGEIQVDAIINGGAHPRTGQTFQGLGTDKFIGAWTRTNITEVEKDKATKYDDQGNEQITHLLVDKTHIIQNFADFIDWDVPNPNYLENVELGRRKLAIPYAEEWKVDSLIREFTSITRKDVETELISQIDDSRQRAQKQFHHPPDSVMSIIYALTAAQYYSQRGYGDFKGVWSSRRGGSSAASSFRGTRR